MLSDNEINRKYRPETIEKITQKLAIDKNNLYNYGPYITKINHKYRGNKNGKLILVTSTSPNKFGIGKTTTTIGINDALNALGEKSIAAIREPSLGPVFGLKGGATGGGKSQAYPIDDINLHFTGDIHAITTANNLICTVIDNHIFQGNELEINPETISFKRVIDLNDRALRNIEVNTKKLQGQSFQRKEQFQLTVASELMAIFSLAKNLEDLILKMEKIIIAKNFQEEDVTVKDLQISASIATLLKQAINPNLVQSIEGNPIFIHGGPFANIAHGTNSLISTNMAKSLTDYVITEAGFGTDLGCEKYFNLVSQTQKLNVDYILLTTSISSLKYYSQEKENSKENNMDNETLKLKQGLQNLQQHLQHINYYQKPYMVVLNQFSTDTLEEIEILNQWCLEQNVSFMINKSYTQGSQGSLAIAQKLIQDLVDVENMPPKNEYIYHLEDDLKTKITLVAQNVYGAKDIHFENLEVEKKYKQIQNTKYNKLPICIAKTPMSFTDNPKIKVIKEEFVITITNIEVKAGAGYILVYLGNILTLPGLGKEAAVHKITYDYNKDETNNMN